MPVTYDPSWPTDKDWLRWRVADNSTGSGLRQDAEYTAALVEYGSKQEAAWRMAQSLYAEFSILAADQKMGQLSIMYSKRAEFYLKLVDELQEEAAQATGVSLWFGGQSKADKAIQEDDSDRVEPSFARNQFATPGFELTAETNRDALST